MLTNVATALFGLADMWVIGRLGDAPAQGAVELGAKFMMATLTVFNFLRTGTIALTAQAAGRGDTHEQATALTRSLAAAIAIGAIILLFKPLVIDMGMTALQARGEVAEYARTYIDIRYWAGTAWLGNAVLVGWLIGQRRVKTVLIVEVLANVVHIALDLLFVLGFDWGVAGIAWATFSSEVLKLVLLGAMVAMVPASRLAWASVRQASTWEPVALKRLFAVNRDLLLRTILLTGAILIFARSGSEQGPVILAANGILFQIFMLSSLILDGFESSSQVLCGEARGADDRERFTRVVRVTLIWGVLAGIFVSAVYAVAGPNLRRNFQHLVRSYGHRQKLHDLGGDLARAWRSILRARRGVCRRRMDAGDAHYDGSVDCRVLRNDLRAGPASQPYTVAIVLPLLRHPCAGSIDHAAAPDPGQLQSRLNTTERLFAGIFTTRERCRP